MEKALRQMVGSVVTVIIQFHGNISLSIRGELEAALDRYHIPGNPAIVFGLSDVSSVDQPHSIIRLTG